MTEGWTNVEGVIILVIGVVIDAIIGDKAFYGKIPHPVVVMGSVVNGLDGLLNKARQRYGIAKVGKFVVEDNKDSQVFSWQDRVRGVVALWLLVVVSFVVGWLLMLGLALLGRPWSWLLEGFLIAILLAGRSLHDHVLRVAKAYEEDSLVNMQAALQHIVSRDTKRLDKWGVARGAFDSLSDNYVDGVLAPLFWWAVAGLPGLLVYKAINTADSMVGYHAQPYRDYGFASAKADDIMNFLPARVAALVVSVASLFVKDASFVRVWQALWRGDRSSHRSPSAGFPVAAFAGALGLRLGGKRVYPGEITVECWIGRGRSKVTAADLHKGLALYRWACFLHLLILGWLWFVVNEGIKVFTGNYG